MTEPDVIPATADVIRRYYGSPPTRTQMAVAVVDGDRVLGVGGVYLDTGRWVMFSDMSDELRRRKRALIRASRAVLDIVRGRAIPVVALADPGIPGSDVLLRHMGAEHVADGVYTWRA